jgi:hypothetical protein
MNNKKYQKEYKEWKQKQDVWAAMEPDPPARPEFKTAEGELIAFLNEDGCVIFTQMFRNTLNLPPNEMLRFSKWLEETYYFG